MGRAFLRAAWSCAALSAVFASPGRAQQGTWALTNARIETVTRGVIERGTIVIRDGLIVALGADVTAPADARVVDLAGKTVFPGIIDLTSSLGLPQTPAPGAGGGGGGAAPGAAQQATPSFLGFEPDRLVVDELRPLAADIKAARDLGITAVLTAPTRGAFRGRSALLPLRDSVGAREVIRSPVALHMGYQGAGGGFGGAAIRDGQRLPGTLLGVMAYERQSFLNARHQDLLLRRYRTSPRGTPRPPNDDALDALIPVVKGEMPVFFAASNENEILRALGIAREFNLQMNILGATEGFRAIEALRAARRPVIVSVDFPRATAVTGWAYRGAQRLPPNDSARADSAGRRVIEGNAAALMQAGIRFALASGGRAADLLPNVRKAIAAGLPRDSALAALTIRPAEIAGVSEQLGSIETGKVANLVVSEGDILGDSAKVRMVFVDGIRYLVDPPAASAAARRPGGRPGAPGAAGPEPSAVSGTWDFTVNSPQGATVVTAVINQNGTAFTGTLTSQMGNSPISNGTIDGNKLNWTTLMPINGQDMTLTYNAEVTGTRITGTVAVGDFGSYPFTGEKRP